LGLRIYNTLTRQKDAFVPLVPGQVSLYVCGITPYDVSHIGHARSALVFDVVARYLGHAGYRVTFVKNYTDVDDKIIARANQLKVPIAELTERYIQAYEADMARLGVRAPTQAPRATAYIPEMVALIERLVASGMAYVVDGDVYFEVARFPTYGRLSGKNLDELLAGARVDVNERKRDPRDFALWKAAKPGEPSWPSPWGPGRPGWHIECSAMAMKHLGETFDLHGGGQDLIFPHHENEIAQSEAATGHTFARFWVQNGLVNLDGEKMSKSTKHFFLIEDVVKDVEPEVIRFYLQSTQYRSPIEWNDVRLREAGGAYERLREALAKAEAAPTPDGAPAPQSSALLAEVAELEKEFQESLDDDFNAAKAQGHLFEMAKSINRVADTAQASAVDRAALPEAGRTLRRLGELIGLFWGSGKLEAEVPKAVQSLVRQRDEARMQKAWRRADELRDEILALGYVLEDSKGGTRARPKS
jgi:cysteinyl-tRNA synthetase